ncbi:glycosyltransferase family 2 protein [Methanosarcina hadiensis]|uniref:glycosyltransferase family 2 protein n=1 Tax=Methanosarcina hadiensis TaxID=3078083 RepID=UPI003977943A
MASKVAIIILNWNGWEDTIECLESVYQIGYPNYYTIVVDNGSKDESIKKIKDYAAGKIPVESSFVKYNPDNKPLNLIEYYREELKSNERAKKDLENSLIEKNLILIKNNENYGFAEGNNIAINYALEFLKPDYILLLNNDTIVDSSFLNELVEIAENDPDIGILGPTIYDYHPHFRVQSAGLKILWNEGNTIDSAFVSDLPVSTQEVDAVTGCALLIKSELLNKIGLLNKKYFAYFEDVEWCIRARKAFYKIVYVPKGKVWHKGGATSKKITGFALYLHTRNRFWFMKQYASSKQYIIFLAYFFGFKLFTFVGWALLHRNKPLIIPFLKGVRDGLLTRG